MKEALLCEKLSKKVVKCKTCPRNCEIPPGKLGFCHTRVNKDGKLHTLIYGVVSKVEVGPIEEKPFYYFYPGTYCLSIGSYGCNFRCKGCQNAYLSWDTFTMDKILKGNGAGITYFSPSQIIQLAIKNNCNGIAFTFNEPAIWTEYVLDTAVLAKLAGLYTVYVTNSFVSRDSLEIIGQYIDAMATDIKSMEDDFYQNLCSAPPGAVKNVLESIGYAHELGIHIETRTNLIPGYNDDLKMLREIATWIKENLGSDAPWHLTRFFPSHELSNLRPTSLKMMKKAQEIGWGVGLKHVNIIADKSCDCAKRETFSKKCWVS
jgi:pyruvate formate lyase activating enzyme